MRTVLRDRGVLDHQELIFVAHSMGGLAVKAFLLTFREYVQRTKFIYFFGVPSKGTDLTRVARYLTDNPQSREVVPLEAGSYLERQLIDWRTLHARTPRFPIYCAYETVPAPCTARSWWISRARSRAASSRRRRWSPITARW